MPLIARNVDTGEVVADRVGVAATRATRAVGLLTRAAPDQRGVVIDCVFRLKPWRIRLPRRGTAGVLELPVGALERSRTAIGHRIEFQSVVPAPALRPGRGVAAAIPAAAHAVEGRG